MDLVTKVEQHIVQERLLREEDIIVVAVSGGPDSVALLHILFVLSGRWRWRLVVAHVNHRFRGEESEREARFVENLARTLALPCEVGRIDVPAYIAETGMNAQAAAREKRYEFLRRVAGQYGARAIALAHHADDQAETILMRVLQGTGPSGLAGMPIRRVEKKVELIRPLLRIYRSEITDYCKSRQLDFCVDSSNLERKYFRNRVRLTLIPRLGQYNPHLAQSLNRLAETMRAEDDYMAGETERVFTQLATMDERGCRFPRSAYLKLHLALQRRLIKLILSYLVHGRENIDFTGIELARSAIAQESPSNLTLDLGGGVRLIREYGTILLQRTETAPHDYDYIIEDLSKELPIPEAGATVAFACGGTELAAEADASEAESASGRDTAEAVFDLEELELPLRIRSRRAGDRMQVLGLNGSKKVKDIFIDDKIPPRRRNAVPLLVDAAGRILWIPGVRRSAHALITGRTKRALRVKVTYD